jgi:rhodanese-related sulfurtransferase
VAIDSTPSLEVTFITPEHLKARLDAGEYLCLVDARESHEFGMAHIPGAQWCARDLLASQIERVAPTPYVPLVVYCSRGEAATLSVPTLQRLGYTPIFVIQGGFLAWCAAGFPTETGCIDPLTST